MIRNCRRLREFEKRLARRKENNLEKNLKIVDALYREAVALGAFPSENPLEGIETNIRIVRILNSVSNSPHKNSR